MEIYEAVNSLKGNPCIIPDSNRDDFPNFIVKSGYKTGAEIGVHRGEFTEKFCKMGLKMYAIDPWIGFAGQGRTQRIQANQDDNYNHVVETLSPYDCTIIRKTSIGALGEIGDNSLDFVYIDGNHDFPHAAEDIFYWSKKVKYGGIISGHDYFCTAPHATNIVCQVAPVVDAFVKAYNIENWYVFGRDVSWMFLKTWN
jgi:hypothetical protein